MHRILVLLRQSLPFDVLNLVINLVPVINEGVSMCLRAGSNSGYFQYGGINLAGTGGSY